MHVRIKICGIRTPADAALAANLGADAIGLNFYCGSARFVSVEEAPVILFDLPPFVEPIGLFVKEPIQQIKETAKYLSVRTVQIHADTHQPFPFDANLNWIAAFSVSSAADLRVIDAFLERWRVQPWNGAVGERPIAILVDARVPGMYGGTGQVAPWHLLADFKPGMPLILAGGLTPENVAEAIRIVKPYAVDVASGVESAPGQKDADKMRRFIDAVRSTS